MIVYRAIEYNEDEILEIVRDLEKIKEVLESEGWCKGDYLNKRGQYCLIGAIQKVTEPGIGERKVRDILNANIPEDFNGLVAWNDFRSRRKRDVIGLINRTIKSLKKQV